MVILQYTSSFSHELTTQVLFQNQDQMKKKKKGME